MSTCRLRTNGVIISFCLVLIVVPVLLMADEELGRDARSSPLPQVARVSPAAEDNEGEGKTAVSPFYGTIVSQNVIFVIDMSLTMHISGPIGKIDADPPLPADALKGSDKGVKIGETGSREDLAKKELIHVIEDVLSEKTKFNIISFNKDPVPWQAKIVAATASNKKKAMEYVKGLQKAKYTNSFAALQMALSDKHVDTIYFLSDGVPQTPERINFKAGDIRTELDKLKELNKGRVAIHTIALLVGNSDKQAEDFMRDLAKEHKGTYRGIRSK